MGFPQNTGFLMGEPKGSARMERVSSALDLWGQQGCWWCGEGWGCRGCSESMCAHVHAQ